MSECPYCGHDDDLDSDGYELPATPLPLDEVVETFEDILLVSARDEAVTITMHMAEQLLLRLKAE